MRRSIEIKYQFESNAKKTTKEIIAASKCLQKKKASKPTTKIQKSVAKANCNDSKIIKSINYICNRLVVIVTLCGLRNFLCVHNFVRMNKQNKKKMCTRHVITKLCELNKIRFIKLQLKNKFFVFT